MGITSLQVCMDSSDWLQDTIPDDCTGMDHSSSPITTPSGDQDNNILTCGRPLIERRLRPQHEQALKCPRCDSTHTKFCYYNNYSLSQPRYFCKTCRRYWTKGGTLRNIPVGGGCRKNKKVSSNPKKSSNSDHVPSPSSISSSLILNTQGVHGNRNNADLQLGFPEMPFSSLSNPNFANVMNPSFLLENHPTPIDFMENKYDHFMGGGENFGGIMANANNFHGICSPFGYTSLDQNQYGNNSNGNNILESCQRLMIPSYDENHHNLDNQISNNEIHEVKPNAKILSLEWSDHHQQQQQQQQACTSDAGSSFGYNFGGLGSWTGLMNGYGSSAANPLV
ncbi:hypothetical protein BUALT_Bualt07G0032600 [Buddleja alternifolia]|uniref:Dof zinc finger protein n=1 Tax=Buddleja alternifolia TaxID=168488 RepID=A0AAV6XIL5_9LAMI|nr:hypothetical protein BUALT_Bualt07G0032600 [Buddleja alternifolia]